MLLNCGCWRRLLRVPRTARRSNQSIVKEISPGCSLEGLMLKLKLQYFGHLMWRADPLEKTLMVGKIEGDPDAGKDRRQEEQETTEDKIVRWHQQLNGHEFEWTPGDGKGQGGLAHWSPWVAKSWPRLSDWTTESKLLSLTGYTLLAIPSKYWGTIFYYQTDLSKLKLFFKGVFLHKSLRMYAMKNIVIFFLTLGKR